MAKLELTVEAMLSEDYKDRFAAEYQQLVYRVNKLDKMVKKYKAGELNFTPTCTVELLEEQLVAMKKYASVLKKRAKIENLDIKLPKKK